MKNLEIARMFQGIAQLLEVKGDNPFRIRAYQKAAQNLETLSSDIASMAQAGTLEEIPGIGADLAGKIREYLERGTIESYEKLRRESPEGVLNLMVVPGLGPKKARILSERLGVTTLDALEEACRGGKVRSLGGFGRKMEENLLKGIAVVREGRSRMSLGQALDLAEEVTAALKKVPGVRDVEAAGSLRRRKETVRDLDLLVTLKGESAKVMEVFTGLGTVAEVLARGATKSSVRTRDGFQMDLRVIDPESYGSALQYFTGSKTHNVHLREIAVKRGLKVNEYGVFDAKSDRRKGGKTEEEVYRALGLPWIAPELREDTGEIEAAEAGRLPRILELEDLKGDLHAHTRRSDGAHPLGEVVAEAKRRGLAYIAITDHSKSLGIARGLDEKEVLDEKDEIDRLNRSRPGIRVLSGMEVDIRMDGSLDLEEKVLAQLDVVVASVHSGFKQPADDMTRRILKAVRNPHVDILGHPTGRLWGEREGYAFDLEAILQAAVESGVAVEINAYPKRLDLNDRGARRLRDLGGMVAVNTDTHVLKQMDHLPYGVSVARRAWIGPESVLNALPVERLLERLA